MTFANRFVRGAVLGAVAMGLLGVANAQNGSNYHVLSNQAEGAVVGIGAGTTQTFADGLGTWLPGEDMKGSLKADFGTLGVQFTYRNPKFRETMCVFGNGAVTGQLFLVFEAILFTEFDGANGNAPRVFTKPICVNPGVPSVNAPYGAGLTTTVSWLLFGMPAGIASAGVPTSTLMLGPNENILNSQGGTATIVAAAGNVGLGPLTGSGCYLVQFSWTPTTVNYLDDVDGMWHWLRNSSDLNQYWMVSVDEMNLWQSFTAGTDSGATLLYTLPSFVDYELTMSTTEAGTHAVLAPNGYVQNGVYYTQTENMVSANGFDVGRGSHGISFNGLGGVVTTPGGTGNQDPAFGSGAAPHMGFVTWDNKPSAYPAGFGSTRLTWVSIDYTGVFGLNPAGDIDVTKKAGSVRVPMKTDLGGNLQAVTNLAFGFFQHATGSAPSGFPDPSGITSGAFGVNASAGGSFQFPTASSSGSAPCNLGAPVNLTYGTTGLTPTGGLNFNPAVADISHTRELYLWP